MQGFLARLANNAGSALAAGATVLAVGAALGAVGLSEAQGSGNSPFQNGWVLGGVGIMALAALWSVAVFVIAMIASVKTEMFHILLGHALNDGERLEIDLGPYEAIAAWAQQAHDLIEAGIGSAEARWFLSEWDLGIQFVSQKEKKGLPYLRRRLQRLTQLMARMYAMRVGPGAKLPEWEYQANKVAIFPKDQT
jgi:hypothetical protein